MAGNDNLSARSLIDNYQQFVENLWGVDNDNVERYLS